jgi:hypothetical protein
MKRHQTLDQKSEVDFCLKPGKGTIFFKTMKRVGKVPNLP